MKRYKMNIKVLLNMTALIFNFMLVYSMTAQGKAKLASLYANEEECARMFSFYTVVQSIVIDQYRINICERYTIIHGQAQLVANHHVQSRVITNGRQGYYFTVNGVDQFKVPCVIECEISTTQGEHIVRFFMIISDVTIIGGPMYVMIKPNGVFEALPSFTLQDVLHARNLSKFYTDSYANVQQWYLSLDSDAIATLCTNLKDLDYIARRDNRVIWKAYSKKVIAKTSFLLKFNSASSVHIPAVLVCGVIYPDIDMADELYWIKKSDNSHSIINEMIQVYIDDLIDGVPTFTIEQPSEI